MEIPGDKWCIGGRGMYSGAETWVKTVGGDSEHFLWKWGYTRGQPLVSFYLSW